MQGYSLSIVDEDKNKTFQKSHLNTGKKYHEQSLYHQKNMYSILANMSDCCFFAQ